eukprot:TRINITY_DN12723_c0_g1_i1.p1 TRINITY_DN12723_c0_g1~~TRINITY_DN12723_c0_g1_i1.p1  ORF type:complete len:333 (+),score=20.79 TRINITY_DN12723_c0_g1_i1:89-1087(+)
MDLILSQFNLDSPLPTFFEMRAQEELMPILGNAFTYGLTVTAQRVPFLVSVVPWSNEIYTVLWGALDWKLLSSIDSTFAENFYGMKRAIAPPKSDVLQDVEAGRLNSYDRLNKRSRIVSLILVILVPYLKKKLHAYMTYLRDEDANSDSTVFKRLFKRMFPIINFFLESITLLFWLRYLFASPWWSLGLFSQRIILKRLDMADYQHLQTSPDAVFLNRMRSFILWSIVGFRALEWYNSAGVGSSEPVDISQGRPAAIPPPPPPVSLESLGLDAEEDTCPVCRHPITNPTLNACSGLVYCYPCIHQHVDTNKADPITRQPCTLDHLRRIYEAA